MMLYGSYEFLYSSAAIAWPLASYFSKAPRPYEQSTQGTIYMLVLPILLSLLLSKEYVDACFWVRLSIVIYVRMRFIGPLVIIYYVFRIDALNDFIHVKPGLFLRVVYLE